MSAVKITFVIFAHLFVRLKSEFTNLLSLFLKILIYLEQAVYVLPKIINLNKTDELIFHFNRIKVREY